MCGLYLNSDRNHKRFKKIWQQIISKDCQRFYKNSLLQRNNRFIATFLTLIFYWKLWRFEGRRIGVQLLFMLLNLWHFNRNFTSEFDWFLISREGRRNSARKDSNQMTNSTVFDIKSNCHHFDGWIRSIEISSSNKFVKANSTKDFIEKFLNEKGCLTHYLFDWLILVNWSMENPFLSSEQRVSLIFQQDF